MPHAALWVVQLCAGKEMQIDRTCFNAARGFVGGATAGLSTVSTTARNCFNAARGFVGGATNNERYRVR